MIRSIENVVKDKCIITEDYVVGTDVRFQDRGSRFYPGIDKYLKILKNNLGKVIWRVKDRSQIDAIHLTLKELSYKRYNDYRNLFTTVDGSNTKIGMLIYEYQKVDSTFIIIESSNDVNKDFEFECIADPISFYLVMSYLQLTN